MENVTEQTKRCTTCGIVKPLSEFHNQKGKKFGKAPRCKACAKIYNDNYHFEHRAERAVYQAEYNKTHPEVLERGRKKYAEEHKEEIRENRLIRESQPEYKEKKSKRARKAKVANPANSLFLQTRSRAKNSGIIFTIEESDIIIPKFVPFLASPLLGKKSLGPPTLHLLIE
jgi:hypothetical protein